MEHTESAASTDDRTHHRRLITLAVTIVFLVLAASSDLVHLWISEGTSFAEQVIRRHPWWGLALFLLFSALSAMLLFFSSAVLVPVGIQAWGELGTFALLWLGWLLGGMAAYGVGRFLGRRVVQWIVPADKLERYSSRISRRARLPAVILFQLALPSEIPGYVLGILRYRFWKYLAALGIAELPFAVGAVYLGRSFLERDYLALVGVGAAGLLLMALAVILWQKRIRGSER
ncbi:MAG TPA: VTT domain-containing protein [Thermoanaerobaculia bacterium]|nr:VTT domain-containing protein [Thermoanaerobaculia bacterium]